jgi:hypothetical protein
MGIELVPKPGRVFHKLLRFFGLRPAKPLFFKVAVPKLKFWNSLDFKKFQLFEAV